MCGETPDKFTGTYQLIADVIVEFEPDTGKVVHEWHLADYFHPQTNPADSNICPFAPAFAVPVFMYTSFGDVKDWTHANAVVLDEKRNALLVSSRHMNAVLAIRYADDADGKSGDLLWRLGPGRRLHAPGLGRAAVPPARGRGAGRRLDPPLRQRQRPAGHRPRTRPTSTSTRTAAPCCSASTTTNKTVTQKWEMRSLIDGRPLYAFFVGDADHQPNGNILIDNGGITDPAGRAAR